MTERESSSMAPGAPGWRQWASVRASGFPRFAGSVGVSIASILAGVLGAVDPGGLRHAFNAGGGSWALLACTAVVTAGALAGGGLAAWLTWRLEERSWRRTRGALAREAGLDEAIRREVLGDA
jgi:hypothetical protein